MTPTIAQISPVTLSPAPPGAGGKSPEQDHEVAATAVGAL
jgi:hypothetical protein